MPKPAGQHGTGRALLTRPGLSTDRDGFNPFQHKKLRPCSLLNSIRSQINAPTFAGRSKCMLSTPPPSLPAAELGTCVARRAQAFDHHRLLPTRFAAGEFRDELRFLGVDGFLGLLRVRHLLRGVADEQRHPAEQDDHPAQPQQAVGVAAIQCMQLSGVHELHRPAWCRPAAACAT